MNAFIHVKNPENGMECWLNTDWVTRVERKTFIAKEEGQIAGARIYTTGGSSYDSVEPPEKLLKYLVVNQNLTIQSPGVPPAGDSAKQPLI